MVGRPAKPIIGNARWSRGATRLGLFAILFQAILFGFHHHDLAVAGSGHQQTAIVQNGTAPTAPADAEDGCEICSVLHHQLAAAGDFAAAPLPAPVAWAPLSGNTAFVAHSCALAFHARAPPLA